MFLEVTLATDKKASDDSPFCQYLCICCGSDSSPQISPRSQQIRVRLSATCCRVNPPSSRTHAIPIFINLSGLICCIATGATPPPKCLQFTRPPADEKQSSAACRRECHTSCCLHLAHYSDPHGWLMQSPGGGGVFFFSPLLTCVCIFFIPLSLIREKLLRSSPVFIFGKEEIPF